MARRQCSAAASAAVCLALMMATSAWQYGTFVFGIAASPSLRGALPAQGLTLQGI
eukprot:CAMPEP_0183555766 /NCGR_PEP_ID=MMETSP0371-20130417/80470_1 /TAXON_ID=268820 /ORGANISM="Peridinium aciculiferum, Strain PAER-2" /LENGTH=54 /DNA_ID=CAMNT_0025762095 /DNA_START=1 /DNA_END=162 /DNA_ORIENTATION=-